MHIYDYECMNYSMKSDRKKMLKLIKFFTRMTLLFLLDYYYLYI